MSHSGRTHSKSALFIFLFFVLPLSLSAADWATVIDRAGPSIGRVLIKDMRGAIVSQGTGFIIEDPEGEQIFVTNAHVVRDAWYDKSHTIEVAFDYGNRNKTTESAIGGQFERYDEYLDLSLLRLDEEMPLALPLDNNGGNGLMSEIVVAGYPLGKNFKATPGMIQAFQTVAKLGDMIDMSADLAPGNSGGPVLNGSGEVVGVATAVIRGYNFNFAIPVGNLQKFLDYGNNTVTLQINSDPEGSRVFINGDYKGETPLSLDLFNNQYDFRIEKEGHEPLEETLGPWETSGQTVLEKSLTAIVEKDPTIRIITDPEGADIFVGNTKIGVSPVSIEMPAGRILRIKAQKGLFKKGSANYRITDEPEQTVEIDLD